ncbi:MULTISPECIES: hypothetical protein [Actinomycetes]|uniref:hypothetical protein n=1 Tax=Actinomycetes TaxID=1760 RepID=UPI0001DEE197|nr:MULTISPECIES: hypothetical protein [Actinomycetes]EFL04405.1 predicted protein [Streptomyces sp. AA4]
MSGPVLTPEDRAWTLALVAVSPHRHLLARRAHHVVADGYTGRWRLWRVAEAYRALGAGEVPLAPEDVAVGEVRRSDADYW